MGPANKPTQEVQTLSITQRPAAQLTLQVTRIQTINSEASQNDFIQTSSGTVGTRVASVAFRAHIRGSA